MADLVNGVDFVFLPTQDFEAVADFYENVLGLRCSARYGKIPGGEFETGSLTLQVIDGSYVATAGSAIVGFVSVYASPHGYADLGMAVVREWRGRGVGSALLAAAIESARARGLHKVSLEVFAHNGAATALYRKFGFVEEGRRVKQYRRQSGELWDAIEMGLLL